jgi:hypothetical protein
MGEEYIRIQAARYYLTDFFKSPVAYITGNGMYFTRSSYGRLISLNALVYKYNLGDIGIIGDYAMYGLFFVLGVLIICIKAIRIRMKHEHFYVKYIFIAVIISLPTSGGFGDADFVCFIACILYLIDVSNRDYLALNISGGNNNIGLENPRESR